MMSDRNEVGELQETARQSQQEKFLFIYELPASCEGDEVPVPSDTSSLLQTHRKHEMLRRVPDGCMQVISNMYVVDYSSKEKLVESIFPRLLVLNHDKTLL